MDNYVVLKTGAKEYKLRIYLREVAELKKKINGKTYLDAAMNCMDDPAAAVPFIWAAAQKNTGHDPLTEDGVFDLCDELISSGYDPEKFTALVIDICVVSGFFTKAVGEINKRLVHTAFESLAKGPKEATASPEALKMAPIDMTKQKTQKRSTNKA